MPRMRLNFIQSWDSSSGALENKKFSLIAITLMSTLTQSDVTTEGSIFASNWTVWPFNYVQKGINIK